MQYDFNAERFKDKFSSFFVIFLGLFSKRNRKHFLRVSIELEKHS